MTDLNAISETIAARTRHSLGVTGEELESLFTADPVGGYRGTETAARLRARFRIPDDTDLADGLEIAGRLSAAEAAWLADETAPAPDQWLDWLSEAATPAEAAGAIPDFLTERDYRAHHEGELTLNVASLWNALNERWPGCELRLWGSERRAEIQL